MPVVGDMRVLTSGLVGCRLCAQTPPPIRVRPCLGRRPGYQESGSNIIVVTRLAVFAFWIGAIIIGILFRLIPIIRDSEPKPRPIPINEQEEAFAPLTSQVKPRPLDYPSLYLKRFVTVPATFGYKCLQNVGWCTIPPRVESLIILVFIAVNTLLCVTGYPIFVGNL